MVSSNQNNSLLGDLMYNKLKLICLLLSGLAGLSIIGPVSAQNTNTQLQVIVSELTVAASKGQLVFNTNCASCHGINARGGTGGPPLIHNIYNPGHHSNEAFVRAVRNGVQQHHWQFGNMPPQKQVAFGDMVFLLKFIRQVQQQNGIKTVAHKM